MTPEIIPTVDVLSLRLNCIGSNQTELIIKRSGGDTVILFSYNTPVAARNESGVYFVIEKPTSRTTSKHINAWMPAGGVRVYDRDSRFFDSLLSFDQC